MFNTRRLWTVAALVAATTAVPAQSIVGDAGFPVCFGDGTGGKCPAGHFGLPGHGCDNSVRSGGALLAAHGFPSISDDTLVLTVDELPTARTAIYLQAWKLASPPTAFGDGLLCLAGSTLRLAAKPVNAGSSSFPARGDPSLSQAGKLPGGGVSVFYQVLYRDNYVINGIARSNLSNAWRTAWAP